MSVDGPSEPPSLPEAGTILNTFTGIEYPTDNGGSSFYLSEVGFVPNQICSVYLKADGVGGSYYDWANVFDVSYKPSGQSFYSGSGTSYVTINGTDYSSGSYSYEYFHDGSGSYYTSGSSSYSPYGDYITSDNNSGSSSISTPVGSFTYENWSGNSYYHDGSGSYYSNRDGYSQATDGTFIGTDSTGGSSQTEVPSGSGNYFTYGSWSSIDYYYQLSGNTYSYYYQGVMSANYGDYITNDGTYSYYWDGTGGYYYY
jgi:hypothetical protein